MADDENLLAANILDSQGTKHRTNKPYERKDKDSVFDRDRELTISDSLQLHQQR